MHVRLIDTGKASADDNMRYDQQLLESLTSGSVPILHLYDWASPSLTFGYFTQLAQHLDCKALQKQGIAAARRPTGGGIIFHLWDFAYSIVIPASHPGFSQNTITNYRTVNGVIAEALAACFGLKTCYAKPQQDSHPSDIVPFCMASHTIYDILLDGKKIGGAAQRKTKQGLLHQGTVFMTPPDYSLLQQLLLNKTIPQQMLELSTYALAGYNQTAALAKQELSAAIAAKLGAIASS